MKIPLIKTNGNLIKFIKSMISEVISAGFAATKTPRSEPRIAIKNIPKYNKIIAQIELKGIQKIMVNERVMMDVMIKEYNVDAIIIPKRIF